MKVGAALAELCLDELRLVPVQVGSKRANSGAPWFC